jgi:hypothetical protein
MFADKEFLFVLEPLGFDVVLGKDTLEADLLVSAFFALLVLQSFYKVICLLLSRKNKK